MRNLRGALAGLLLLAVLGACRFKASALSAAPDQDTAVLVEVENHYLAW